ncbi:MAG TPA: hypothetical protein VK797_22800 [Tepidisphaeraceae bacterium]|jgi:hypothetical protein|nr:hypothetical protein [Tepidisphaeraceae bacterium]
MPETKLTTRSAGLPSLDDFLTKFDRMTNEQIAGRITELLGIDRNVVLEIAAGIKTIELRDPNSEELQRVKEMTGLFEYCRRVAFDNLYPDIIVRFHGEMLRYVAALTRPDQEKVCASERMLYVVIENGETKKTWVPTMKMRTRHIRQIFNDRKINDEGDQIAYARAKIPNTGKTTKPYEILKGGTICRVAAQTDWNKSDLLMILGRMK